MNWIERLFADLRRLVEERPPRPSTETLELPAADNRPPPSDLAHSQVLTSADEIPMSVPEPEAGLPIPVAEPDVTPFPEPEPVLPIPVLDPEASAVSAREGVAAPEPAPAPSAAWSEATITGRVADADQVGDVLVLALVGEGAPTATFTVARLGATLGRGDENTIRLVDLSVSRRHARIVYRQGGYWLSDVGSMGGTWIDGTRLSAAKRIATGQIIDIGHCRLSVSFVSAAVEAEAKRRASKPRSEMARHSRRLG